MNKTDTTAELLAEHLRLRPETTAVRAVAAVGAEPSIWVDIVDDALDSDDPPAAIRSADVAGVASDHGEKASTTSVGPDSTDANDREETADGDDHHVDLSADRVHSHYQRVRSVYEQLATVGEYPTMGLDDLAGWYITQDEFEIEPIQEGYTKRRRPASFEKDLDTVLDRVERTVYGLTTYKSPAAFRRWTPARLNDGNEYEYRGGDNPTPVVEDLRAVSVWGDIDLCDELKGERGNLDEDTRATAEATLEAYAEEFGKLVGGTDAVYGLDSVGGAYLFTAPEVTIEIAEYVQDEYGEEWVGEILRTVIDRSNDYLKEAQERVEARIDGAADVIDPDWANNHNRKYKAPLAIHKDHDAVVTPIDPDDVDYSVTRLDDVDDDLVAAGEEWAREYTANEFSDRTAILVGQLFDEDSEADGWRSVLDEHIEQLQEERRKREELRKQTDGEHTDDRDLDLSEHDITPRIEDVEEAIDELDIESVADGTIVSRWTEQESGLTDRSGAGKKAIVPTWAGSYNSGNATYIDLEKGIFNDTDSGDYGTAVEMALIDREGWPVGKIARGDDWARGVQYLREAGYDIPVWTPDARTAQDDKMPYWALRSAAIALGVLDEDELVHRDSDTGDVVDDPADHDGGTYQAFPPGVYGEALDAIEEAGLETGRGNDDRDDDTDDYDDDPREARVVLEPRRAWEAARRVQPEDLTEPLDIPTADDGTGWKVGEHTVDVVRAVAVTDYDTGPEEPLDGDSYDRAYRAARDRYGAPLPEYVTEADAADRFDVVVGAIRELDFFDLDQQAFNARITEADAGDVTHYIDPDPVDGWRESETGESVLVFDSGNVWDADTEETIDALRLVALDAGLIDSPTDVLRDGKFEEAYRTARDDYGAPLPRWAIGDPDVEPILPPAEELVDEDLLDPRGELDAARDQVERLYRSLAHGDGDSDVSVLQVLPSLGKTTSAIKTAGLPFETEKGEPEGAPTTYLAPRKDLMKQAAAKAKEYGAAYAHLPVLGGDVNDTAVSEAVEIIREEGQQTLRNPWELLSRLDEDVFPEEDSSTEDVELDRPTCPTARGEHGEAWALAVHVARELDYTPKDLHTRAEGLFGRPLPCQEHGDCEYSRGWDAIADPEAPIDLLIGSYGHAHVESARTYYDRDERDQIRRQERAVVIDEYPGDTFTEEFGDEFVDHAVWLANSLRDDIEDRQDLFRADLWGDDYVRAWLRGEAQEHDGGAIEAAECLADVADAVDAAEELLTEYSDLIEDVELEAPFTELVDSFSTGVLDTRTATKLGMRIRRVAGGIVNDQLAWLRGWVEEDIADPLDAYQGDDPVEALPDQVGGDLRALVEAGVEAIEEGDGSGNMLRAATTALNGGNAGCRELAVFASGAFAHRKAHRLLEGLIAPAGGDGIANVIETPSFTYDLDSDDGARLKHARVDGEDGSGADTILVDRNHNGATILSPPSRIAGNGKECPVVGLDATARRRLWSLMLGCSVELEDIHETRAERARFLRDALGLQVIRMSDRPRSYEGDPAGKDLDSDVALLEEIASEFSGVSLGDRNEIPTTVGRPACITTKCVRNVLEEDERLDDTVSAWSNYGAVTGDNDLGEHRLAALLGSQHYGDHTVEKIAALAGEEVSRSGRGATLEYGSPIGDTMLKHMREDQVMQAALRFTRGGSGAVVFARTSALRRDLPTVGEGKIVRSWSHTAQQVAKAWKRRGGEQFTVSDVVDDVEVTRRQVRRILDEFEKAGYLTKHRQGRENEYTPGETPTAGVVDLPTADPVADPDTSRIENYYTGNVRVWGVGNAEPGQITTRGSILPAPDDVVAVEDGPPPA